MRPARASRRAPPWENANEQIHHGQAFFHLIGIERRRLGSPPARGVGQDGRRAAHAAPDDPPPDPGYDRDADAHADGDPRSDGPSDGSTRSTRRPTRDAYGPSTRRLAGGGRRLMDLKTPRTCTVPPLSVPLRSRTLTQTPPKGGLRGG